MHFTGDWKNTTYPTMKLRNKYILFVCTIHIVTLVLTYFIFKQNKIYFIVAEVFILLSALLAWQLYNQLIQPLKLLLQGSEAIKDRDFNVKFVKTGKYEMDELIDVYNNMIDQLRKERTRQEQQHFFLEKLINTSPTGIIILDYNDHIQQVNPKALDLLKGEEKNFVSRSVNDINHPIIEQIKQLRSGESKTITVSGATTYKIQKSHFIDRGFPRHFIMIEELTAEILAAEKKVYGKVIRMMAHEVNNTIGPVNSIMQSALKTQSLWNDVNNKELQNALQVAVERNHNLNQFMRNFADLVKLPEPHKKKTDLIQLVNNVVKLMTIRAREKHIHFNFNLPNNPVYIFADEQQMEQALINIVKNAIEAIDGGGVIFFKVDTRKKELIITDTGKGISAENNEQLFSPFFSTKKDGQGIGLTLVREILLNHGFKFSLQTIAPQQTEFVIGY